MTSPEQSFTYSFPFANAVYKDHPNSEYAGNPLISCLEFFDDDDVLIERLEKNPRFDESQRSHSAAVRATYVSGLTRTFFALSRTVVLVRALISLMAEGYVGRQPFSADAQRRMQALYYARKEALPFEEALVAWNGRNAGAELSTAFIGAAGAGKTATMRALESLFPPAIYHKGLSVWQVPVLRFELPVDGRSMHALATAIITALDKRFPSSNYAGIYLRKGRKNSTERLYDAVGLISTHAVGLIVVDECQYEVGSANRDGKPIKLKSLAQGEAPLISLLISASNLLEVPLVLVGTNELHDVMDGRFSRGRRSSGHGVAYWNFLERSGSLRAPKDYEVLLRRLWKYQWVQKPVKLSEQLATLFFELTQGVPDIIVKLFASAQRHAINEGVEELTEEVIRATYEEQFKPVHKPLKAHGEQNPLTLSKYPDIAPTGLKEGAEFSEVATKMHLQNVRRKRGEAAATASSTVEDSNEQPPRKRTRAKKKDAPPAVTRMEDKGEGALSAADTAKPKVKLPEGVASASDELDVLDAGDLGD